MAFTSNYCKEHGVFAKRSPNRLNPISLGIVELLGISGGRLQVRGLDALEDSTGSAYLDLILVGSRPRC